MQYFITLLEGVISFISPCMLPMLPIYISYFAGNADKKHMVFLRALAFVLGFTLLFTALGLFAGTIGQLLIEYQTAVNIICGAVVIIFGLGYLDILRLPFFGGMQSGRKVTGFFSAFLFGVIYSINLTPCVGAFLGSALMQASHSGSALTGFFLLLCYCAGLGIPFLFSAVLIDRLHTIFGFIKRNYRTINIICGIFLILVGVSIMFGLLNSIMALFAR